MKRWSVLLFLLCIATVLNAEVIPITVVQLTGDDLGKYQNNENNPCIFYGPGTCPQQPAELQAKGDTKGTFYSLEQTYSVGLIRSIIGDTFLLGLDVNEGGAPQFLSELGITPSDPQSDSFALQNGMQIPVIQNGGGYADYLIGTGNASALTPFSIAGLPTTDTIAFNFGLSTANDGAEKLFFVVSSTGPDTAVPEPASVVLLGSALSAITWTIRRRRRV